MPADFPILDTHQHLWDLTQLELPWNHDNEVLTKNFTMQDYLQATQGLNVVKTIYMEVHVAPKHHEREADFVLDLCGRDDNPMRGAVIGGRPASDEFAKYIAKYAENKYLRGVRQVLHEADAPTGYCLDPKFVKGVQLLGEKGLCFDICMRSNELLDADKLVAQCPRTKFVVDHGGNMSVQETDPKQRQAWQDGMKALAQRDNTVCKISGIVASAKKDWKPADLAPNMNFAMDTFGPDRVMFAGDWPVCTLRASFRDWLGALREITRQRPAADQHKLFHDNAVKFYRV